MKTKIGALLPLLIIVPPHSDSAGSNGTLSYLIGGIIALFILGYLIYTLLRPENF